MALASFTGLLRTLFIIIFIYYALRFIFRIFGPVIVQQVVKKAGQDIYSRQQQAQQNYTSQAQEQQKADKPKEKQKIGEYIDFEEID